MKRRFRFATADFDFCSLQLSLVAGGVVNFLLAENVIEDEDESTREMGRGQLPKFGAVEENAQADFVGCVEIKKIRLERLIQLCGGAVFLRNQNWEKKFSVLDQFYFHRRCTGNAEKQLSVLGCPLDLYRVKTYCGSSLLDSRGGFPP